MPNEGRGTETVELSLSNFQEIYPEELPSYFYLTTPKI